MRVIDPIKIDEGKLLESNVEREPYGEWDPTIVYRRGRRTLVTDPGIQKIYESLHPNIEKYPPNNLLGPYPAWVEVGPMSIWSMFQEVPDLQSRNKESIEVLIAPGEDFDAISLHGLQSRILKVELLDENDQVVHERVVDLMYTIPDENCHVRSV